MARLKSFILGISAGNLLKSTQMLLRKIGIDADYSDRLISRETELDSVQNIKFLNSKNVPRSVYEGVIDAGITGWDRVVESGLKDELIKIAEFDYSKESTQPAHIVMFSKQGKKVKRNTKVIRVITEYPNISIEAMSKMYPEHKIIIMRDELEKEEVSPGTKVIEIHPVEGGAEQVVLDGLGEFGFCVSESGESLRNNDLKIVKKVLRSPVVLIAKKETEEIKYFAEALGGSLRAEEFLLIKANVTKEIIKEATKILPSAGSPTVNSLEDGGYAVEAEIPQSQYLDLYTRLRKLGATGIISINLNTSG